MCASKCANHSTASQKNTTHTRAHTHHDATQALRDRRRADVLVVDQGVEVADVDAQQVRVALEPRVDARAGRERRDAVGLGRLDVLEQRRLALVEVFWGLFVSIGGVCQQVLRVVARPPLPRCPSSHDHPQESATTTTLTKNWPSPLEPSRMPLRSTSMTPSMIK